MKFNPKEKPKINKTIRMDEELVKTVYRIAGERNISFNKLIVLCIEYALANIQIDENDLASVDEES